MMCRQKSKKKIRRNFIYVELIFACSSAGFDVCKFNERDCWQFISPGLFLDVLTFLQVNKKLEPMFRCSTVGAPQYALHVYTNETFLTVGV